MERDQHQWRGPSAQELPTNVIVSTSHMVQLRDFAGQPQWLILSWPQDECSCAPSPSIL